MRIAGLLLLLAGWIIVMTAVMLLKGAAGSAFIVAGAVVEVVGLVLFLRGHLALAREIEE